MKNFANLSGWRFLRRAADQLKYLPINITKFWAACSDFFLNLPNFPNFPKFPTLLKISRYSEGEMNYTRSQGSSKLSKKKTRIVGYQYFCLKF